MAKVERLLISSHHASGAAAALTGRRSYRSNSTQRPYPAGAIDGATLHWDPKVRRRFNEAAFDQIVVRDGRIAEGQYKPPFGLLSSPEFEHFNLELQTGACSNFSDM